MKGFLELFSAYGPSEARASSKINNNYGLNQNYFTIHIQLLFQVNFNNILSATQFILKISLKRKHKLC